MKTQVIKKILLKSKESKSIISARQFGDNSTQFVGYILDFNESIFIMQQVTVNGIKDGILIELIEKIETFECGEYEKAYQYLYNNFTKIENQNIDNIELPKSENWKHELIKQLHSFDEIITIQLESDRSLITGKIISFDETHLEFYPIDNTGKNDCVVIYTIANISTFTVNELESRRLKLFVEWRNQVL